MRCIYDHLYYMQTQSEITLADNADKLHNQSRLPNLFKYVPNSLNIQNIYVLSNYMNNQLKAKIEQVASQSKIFIRDKSKIERFFETRRFQKTSAQSNLWTTKTIRNGIT